MLKQPVIPGMMSFHSVIQYNRSIGSEITEQFKILGGSWGFLGILLNACHPQQVAEKRNIKTNVKWFVDKKMNSVDYVNISGFFGIPSDSYKATSLITGTKGHRLISFLFFVSTYYY